MAKKLTPNFAAAAKAKLSQATTGDVVDQQMGPAKHPLMPKKHTKKKKSLDGKPPWIGSGADNKVATHAPFKNAAMAKMMQSK